MSVSKHHYSVSTASGRTQAPSVCPLHPPPRLTGLLSLCFSVRWSKVAAVAPRQASQGKKQWVWPPSEPSTHRS